MKMSSFNSVSTMVIGRLFVVVIVGWSGFTKLPAQFSCSSPVIVREIAENQAPLLHTTN